jgi:branched-chain amino acid transport system permease protein
MSAASEKPAPSASAEAANMSALNRRIFIAHALLVIALLVLPGVANPYLLSTAILVLYFAFAGQAWNIMMGFCGQLSLGHSLYVGVGAYTAAALFVHFNISPWLGIPVAIAVCALMGLVIGFLAFRFGIGGVYFALLTIAFSEFTRIGFEHWGWLGATGGFFLPMAKDRAPDFFNLRGTPQMFYFLMLGFCIAAYIGCWKLKTSRAGYYWRAIRENEEAARALGIDTFRYKLYAVALSAGMTSIAGVFFAFYYNVLFPDQIFSMNRSIELILGPIIGGMGTLFGPVLGAAVLTLLGEGLSDLLAALGIQVAGVKQVFYGLCLLLAISFLPHGIWPWLARKLKLNNADEGA